mgnify:FL=1
MDNPVTFSDITLLNTLATCANMTTDEVFKDFKIMANKKIPLRKCVGCNAMKEKKEMIRVIKTPENEIVLDATGRKNGRGAYICADPECLRLARKSKGLERSLKTAIPQDVYESLEKEMSTLA